MVMVASFLMIKVHKKTIFQDIDRSNITDLMIRNSLGVIIFNLLVYVTTLIPLALMSLLLFSAGFWASIIGYYIFGDKLHRIEVAGIFIAYLSISSIVIGGLMMNYDGIDSSIYIKGVVLGLFMSLLNAVIMVYTRKLGMIHYSVLTFHYGFLGLTTSMISIIFSYILNGFYYETSITWLTFLILIGICVMNSTG
mmetsp:Transcript_12275/g.8925  ORF Transcript_12275/g.8925 Transcript_12275/m.8925 type:complete len:195 (-) Transcript_12275:249-833(-)